jgi:hypothetical protein
MRLGGLIVSVLALSLGFSTVAAAQEKPVSETDPSGTWRWEYDLDGQTMKDLVRLNLGKDGAVSGTYHGRSEKPIDIQEGKISGDAITFRFSLDFQGTPVKVAFKGKIKDDDLNGTVVATTPDGDRDFEWKAKRSVQMEDVVGNWQLKIEAGDRTLEPAIEITKDGDKYKGRYTSGGQFDVIATNLRVEKNKLMFSIAGEFNGTKIKGDYQGRPYGDKIRGSIAYELGDQSGDIDFTGVRKPNAK